MYGSYSNSFSDVSDIAGAFSGFLMGMSIFFFVIFLAWGALYVLQALGLQRMAKSRGEKMPWLAWVPLLNYYLIGNLVGPVKIGKFEIRKTGTFMALLMLSILNVELIGLCISVALNVIPLLGQIVSILLMIALSLYPTAVTIMSFIILYKLYKQYAPEKATMFLILSIFFQSIMLAVFFFTYKDKPPVELPALDPDDYPNQNRMQ